MAIRQINKATWPELKKLMTRDGYRFVCEAIERGWEREDKLHEMIYELTAKNREIEEKLYWIEKHK